VTTDIPTNATTVIAAHDPAEALVHGARHGLSSSSGGGFSFEKILCESVRTDAKCMKESISVANLAAQDPTSAPDFDSSLWHSSHENDAPASDSDTADDRRDWKARDEDSRDLADQASDSNQVGANAHVRVDGVDEWSMADPAGSADVPWANAGDQPAKSALGTYPSADAAGSGQNARDTSDPANSQARPQETHSSPASQALRSAACSDAHPTKDRPDVAPRASALAGQANELAKSLHAGSELKINVSVAKPGDTLFSQPASSLAAAAVAGGQKSGAHSGDVPVGASAKAGFVAAPNPGQAPAATQPNIQVNGKSGAVDLQLQTGTQGSEAKLAAVQPKNAGTTVPAQAGSFADVTGIGSSGAPQAAQKGVPGPLPEARTSAPSQPPVTEQISVQISKAVKAGIDRIDIQLRPKELGRVDVRLELTGDGKVNATVTVDTRETLELLKTDARGLERALDDAGLKSDSNSLNFNLRGQDGRPSGNQLTQSKHSNGSYGEGEVELGGDTPARTLGDYSRGGLSADGRINIEI